MRTISPILFAVFCACAKVGTPAGGPPDKTPPRIVAHTPSADATQVPLDAAVEIVFSERMDRRRTEEAVFVAPEAGLSWHWRGERLQLDLDLQVDRTYVVTVGTDARDGRGNALEHSFTFAFATGARLNQGRIKGGVFKEHRPAAAMHVWAYALANLNGVLGHQNPDYRTQSGQDGRYEFSRLSAAEYRIMAFADENRNRQYDEGEWLALPAGDAAAVEDEMVEVGDMLLAERATAIPSLRRVQALHQRLFLLLFDRAVAVQQLRAEVDGLEIVDAYGSAASAEKVYLITERQESGREYTFARLEVAGQPIVWEEPVRGSARTDQLAPTLVERRPQQRMARGDTAMFIFSEAMQQQAVDDFWVASDSTWSPSGDWQWLERTVLAFVPSPAPLAGEYRLVGRGAMLRDLHGNALQDSTIAFALQVLGSDKLAGLEGQVVDAFGDAVSAVWVRALHLRQGRFYSAFADADGHYTLADLLPGAYAFFAFVDENGNGVYDPGQLQPFERAEPYVVYAEELDLNAGQFERVDLRFAW